MNKRINRIFGLHAVKQVLESAPETILSASIQESIQSESVSSLRELLNKLGVSIQIVPRVALNRMVKNQNHQGILLEVQKKTKKIKKN